MKQREYIKPKMKVREMRLMLMNDVSVPNMPWGAKENSRFSDYDVQQGVDELDRMFE